MEYHNEPKKTNPAYEILDIYKMQDEDIHIKMIIYKKGSIAAVINRKIEYIYRRI